MFPSFILTYLKENPFRFPDQSITCNYHHSHACYMPHPPHQSLCVYLLLIFGTNEQARYLIFPSTLFSKNLKLRSSLNARNQILSLQKTIEKLQYCTLQSCTKQQSNAYFVPQQEIHLNVNVRTAAFTNVPKLRHCYREASPLSSLLARSISGPTTYLLITNP